MPIVNELQVVLEQKDYESWDSWGLFQELNRARYWIEEHPTNHKVPLWRAMRDHIIGILEQRGDSQ